MNGSVFIDFPGKIRRHVLFETRFSRGIVRYLFLVIMVSLAEKNEYLKKYLSGGDVDEKKKKKKRKKGYGDG